MLIRIEDIHRVFCGPGIVKYARDLGLDLRSVMREGVEEEVLRDLGLDAEVDQIIAAKKAANNVN